MEMEFFLKVVTLILVQYVFGYFITQLDVTNFELIIKLKHFLRQIQIKPYSSSNSHVWVQYKISLKINNVVIGNFDVCMQLRVATVFYL